MQSKLYDKVKQYANSTAIRFHMPAHNGEDIGIDTSMDITELSFSDNLIESSGIIANTEQNIAKVYGTNYALMLTNGATLGVAIALNTAKNFGDKLLIIGDCHKSVHNYANLLHFNITYSDDTNNINANDFDAILITSPNYFGKVTDISCLKNTNTLVIVDASHGAHFPFSHLLPNLQTDIADITILSFHKTLPVLTGGAGVICNDSDIYDMLCYSRSIMHSSSPSYLTMASIDKGICSLSTNGETLYADCIQQIYNFEKLLCERYSLIKSDDKTRLCISAKGIDASKIADELEKQNIYVEMTYNDIIVAIVTPYNYKHLTQFAYSLNKIDIKDKLSQIRLKKASKIATKCKKVVFLKVQDCLNKICAGSVGIYPPGTPIITNGDLIDKEVIAFLSNTDCEIFGLVNGKIPVYEQ